MTVVFFLKKKIKTDSKHFNAESIIFSHWSRRFRLHCRFTAQRRAVQPL